MQYNADLPVVSAPKDKEKLSVHRDTLIWQLQGVNKCFNLIIIKEQPPNMA